jgi:hypothetical protein
MLLLYVTWPFLLHAVFDHLLSAYPPKSVHLQLGLANFVNAPDDQTTAVEFVLGQFRSASGCASSKSTALQRSFSAIIAFSWPVNDIALLYRFAPNYGAANLVMESLTHQIIITKAVPLTRLAPYFFGLRATLTRPRRIAPCEL